MSNLKPVSVPDGDEEMSKARASSLFVGSLEKGLQILRVFDRERRDMGLSEIVEASGLDKMYGRALHVHAARARLPAQGRGDPEIHPVSGAVLELGFTYLQTDRLLEYATPLLYDANRRCGETLNITELVDTEVVYVARAPGRHVISVDIFLGMRVPAYACAPGRAILAFLDEKAAAAIIDRSTLRKITPKTIASRAGVLRELKTVRSSGYAIAEEQCYLGEISIAAPIFNGQGQPMAALNASVPNSRWTADRVRDKLSLLVVLETARAISAGPGAAGHPCFHQLSATATAPAPEDRGAAGRLDVDAADMTSCAKTASMARWEPIGDGVDRRLVDHERRRQHDVVAALAIDRSGHGIDHQPLRHGGPLDALVELQDRSERRHRGAGGHEFDAEEKAAAANIADMGVVPQALGRARCADPSPGERRCPRGHRRESPPGPRGPPPPRADAPYR